MTKPLITLPCTAQELENALHAVCDHDGLWGETVCVGHDDKLGICLEIIAETKEKEPQHACMHCANKDCEAQGTYQIVVCNHFIMKGETK